MASTIAFVVIGPLLSARTFAAASRALSLPSVLDLAAFLDVAFLAGFFVPAFFVAAFGLISISSFWEDWSSSFGMGSTNVAKAQVVVLVRLARNCRASPL